MRTGSDIMITRGDDEQVVVPIEDGDAGGWIEDLTGRTIRYKITTRRGDGDTTLSLTDADSEITIETAGSIGSAELERTGIPDTADVVLVGLDQSTTDTLSETKYYHECETEDSNGVSQTVMRGQITVQSSLT